MERDKYVTGINIACANDARKTVTGNDEKKERKKQVDREELPSILSRVYNPVPLIPLFQERRGDRKKEKINK